MAMTRKAFLIQLAGGAWVLAGTGCGGGDDSPATGGGNGAGSACTATISNNHGHAITITAADLNSTIALTFDIRGTADHTHSVTFSAAQLAQLKAGGAVTVSSTSTFGHDHSVSPSCM